MSSAVAPRAGYRLQVEAAAGEDRREVEFPVEEALLFSDRFADLEPRVASRVPRRRLTAPAKSRLSSSASFRSSQLRGRAQCRHAAAVLAGLGFAAEECLACLDPLVEGGRDRAAGVGERPEPERGPGVHDSPQSLVCAVRLAEGLLDLLPGDGLGVSWVLPAPQRDVAPGLRLGDLESAQRQLPQRLDPVRQFDERVDLLACSACR